MFVFPDASRRFDKGQLSFFAYLLFEPFEDSYLFRNLSWSTLRLGRTVRSISAAKLLATSELLSVEVSQTCIIFLIELYSYTASCSRLAQSLHRFVN